MSEKESLNFIDYAKTAKPEDIAFMAFKCVMSTIAIMATELSQNDVGFMRLETIKQQLLDAPNIARLSPFYEISDDINKMDNGCLLISYAMKTYCLIDFSKGSASEIVTKIIGYVCDIAFAKA